VRLRALTPPAVRARGFALALAGRHRRRQGSVPRASLALARPLAGGSTRHLHLHLLLRLRRARVRIEPRAAPALTCVAVPPSAARRAAPALAGGQTSFQTLLRRTERVHERDRLELHVVRDARLEVEHFVDRVLTRSRRLDGEDRSRAGSGTATIAPPPLELHALPPRHPRAAATDPSLPAARSSALAPFDAGAAGTEHREPSATATLVAAPPDVERLAESVLDVIDRRLIAHGERLGRP
jgi:hypothetical protein